MIARFLLPALMMAVAPLSPSWAGEEIVYPALEEPMHRPVFHNDEIDVYDVRLEPGQRSYYHRHSRDQLGISLRTATSLNQTLGEAETAIQTERGSISYIPHSALGGYTHRVRADADPFRVIGIEFVKPAPGGSTRIVAAPDQPELIFSQGRITRLELAPGTTQVITGSLLIATAPGVLKAENGDVWSFDEGGLRWIGDQPARRYVNSGSTPVSLLVLALSD